MNPLLDTNNPEFGYDDGSLTYNDAELVLRLKTDPFGFVFVLLNCIENVPDSGTLAGS